VKRARPVAAGVVPARLAAGSGALLIAAGIGAAGWMAGWPLALVMSAYAGLSVCYSLRLKQVAVVELACVAGGFVLRAIAGGVATSVHLSNWFLIVASFASLFVVAGKRSAEQAAQGHGVHRPVLEEYPPTFLRSVRLLSATVTVAAYCLWAFERSAQSVAGHHHPIWFQLSIVPLVLAVLLLELRFERGQGAAPEELALGDRTLQVLGLLWLALFAIGVYA
jgi:decaprenyl-phosphate phosphoribosyltransferase